MTKNNKFIDDLPELLEGVDDIWLNYFWNCINTEHQRRLNANYIQLNKGNREEKQ